MEVTTAAQELTASVTALKLVLLPLSVSLPRMLVASLPANAT